MKRKLFLSISLIVFAILFTPLVGFNLQNPAKEKIQSREAVAIPPLTEEICRVPALDKALSRYREIETRGGWPQMPFGPTLRMGDSDERILYLRQRLAASGDLAAPANQPDVFDEDLMKAVQNFQARHGLPADGAVGIGTVKELNIPVGERIGQLAASIERCKSLTPFPERRHIVVNIADFTLKLFEDGKLRLTMPVIVGKTDRQTPICHGRISSLVINPRWMVPRFIATTDLLPKIKKDPEYLKKNNIRVLRGMDSDEEIDPATIDWNGLSTDHFPYRLCQYPGSGNSLGRLKFIFANPYDVYLHDTPSKNLFQRVPRTFSSGCIRLARAGELAVYLMQGTSLASKEALTSAISHAETRRLAIPSPIPIHIIYMTAWVDNEGVIQFRPNIYSRAPAM
jgi:L,D-transpeptidase YcbB